MKKTIVSLLFAGCSLTLYAQDDAGLRSIRARNTMTQFSDGTANLTRTGLYGMAPSSPMLDIEGDPYWDLHFGVASVELKGRKELVEGNYVRYDIYKDELEFLLKDGVKVLPGNKVVSVVWQDSIFSKPRFLVNANQFKENGVPLTGFLEILVDKDIVLLKRITLSIKKPTYNQALDVGSKSTKIIKNDQYYVSINQSLTKLNSKKDFNELMPRHNTKIQSFIKDNKIKFNSENDLVALVEYCNTLNGI